MASKTPQFDPMRIVSLRAENFKRLKAVEITPGGDIVPITGRNAQGKTSVLDAIVAALGGAKSIPPKPVRDGADTSEILVDMGDMRVRRTWRVKHDDQTGEQRITTSVVVENAKGARFSSPQQVLDELTGRLTFDPLAFARDEPGKQAAILRDLVGLDFSDIDARRAAAFDERTGVNREVRQIDSRVRAMPIHPNIEPVNIGALMGELDRLNQQQRETEKINDRIGKATSELERLHIEAKHLQDQLRAVKEKIGIIETAKLSDINAAKDAPDHTDAIAAIKQKIASAEAANRQASENATRAAEAERLQQARKQAEDLTSQIAAMDQEKLDAIAAAKMPVNGLAFDSEGNITFNGVPFSQASSAEQLRVSAAIGMALNPTIRVMLIRDGSLLDSESLAAIAEMARVNGTQIWIERVSDGDGVGIVIEDGEVKATEAAIA